MGGTIAALAVHGVAVDVLAVAFTTSVMPPGSSSTQVLLAEFTGACDVLGVHDRKIAWIDDDRARNPAAYLPDLIALIEHGPVPSLATSQPAAVFVPAASHHLTAKRFARLLWQRSAQVGIRGSTFLAWFSGMTGSKTAWGSPPMVPGRCWWTLPPRQR